MDLLPIQATSVPCERVFSASKETATDRRNRLKPNTMEAIQLLKFLAKHQTLNFTAGLSEGDEVVELEDIEEARPVEDLRFFLRSLQEQDVEEE
jgi:hypothetical protein